MQIEIQEKLREKLEKKRGKLKRLYREMLDHPELLKRFSDLGEYLRFEGTLPKKYKKWIILSLTNRFKANETFNTHVNDSGLSTEILEDLINQKSFKVEPFRSLETLVKSYLLGESIDQPTRVLLEKKFGKKGFLELLILTGFYCTLIFSNRILDLD